MVLNTLKYLNDFYHNVYYTQNLGLTYAHTTSHNVMSFLLPILLMDDFYELIYKVRHLGYLVYDELHITFEQIQVSF